MPIKIDRSISRHCVVVPEIRVDSAIRFSGHDSIIILEDMLVPLLLSTLHCTALCPSISLQIFIPSITHSIIIYFFRDILGTPATDK